MGPRRDSRVDQLLDVFGQISLLRELAGELASLGFGGDLAGEQQPKHTLRDNFFTALGTRELLLAVWNGQAMETNTLCMSIVRV